MLTLMYSCILATTAAVREGNCPSITLEETAAEELAKELSDFKGKMAPLTPTMQNLVNAEEQVVKEWPKSLQALSTTLEPAVEALKEAKAALGSAEEKEAVGSLAAAMQEASQAKLRELDNEKQPGQLKYMKDYIPVFPFNQNQPVPEELIAAKIIGKVDYAKYPKTLNAEGKGALSLQFKDNGEPDFYPIDQQTFENQYTELKWARDPAKDDRLEDFLRTALKLDIDESDSQFSERRDDIVNHIMSKIQYRTKKDPVTMIKVSGLGVSAEQDLTIVPSWDAFTVQKKTENQDAFLVLEKGKYYMVNAENSDSNSKPIAYFPAPQ